MTKKTSTALAVPTAASISNDLMKEAGVSNTINQSDLVEYATEKLRVALTQQSNAQAKLLKELEAKQATTLTTFGNLIRTHFKSLLPKNQLKRLQQTIEAERHQVKEKTVNKENKTVEIETWSLYNQFCIDQKLQVWGSFWERYNSQPLYSNKGRLGLNYESTLSSATERNLTAEEAEQLDLEDNLSEGLSISSSSTKTWSWSIPEDYLQKTLSKEEQESYSALLASISETKKLKARIDRRLANINDEKAKLKTKLIGAFLKGSNAGSEIKKVLDAMVPTVDESLEENLLGSGDQVIDAQ